MYFLCYFYPLLVCGSYPPQVTTKWSYIEGIKEFVENEAVNTFLGIPYAEAPLGSLRFKKPQPKQGFSFLQYYAGTYRSACLDRYNRARVEKNEFLDEGEDCLYLNVWSPEDSLDPSKLRPVIVYLHDVSTDNRKIDGKVIAAIGNVTVVTFNYRSGIFGMIENKLGVGIDAEPAIYHDTKALLEWVQENIKLFGGNPNQVTLLADGWQPIRTALSLRNYYNQVILRNGPIEGSEPTVASADEIEKIAKDLGCSQEYVLGCLRMVYSKDLMESYLTISPTNAVRKTDTEIEHLSAVLDPINDLATNDWLPSLTVLTVQINTQHDVERVLADGKRRNWLSQIDSGEIESKKDDFKSDTDQPCFMSNSTDMVRAIQSYLECPLIDLARDLARSTKVYSLLVDASVPETSSDSSFIEKVNLSSIRGSDLIAGLPILRNDTASGETLDLAYELIHSISRFVFDGQAYWPEFSSSKDGHNVFQQYRFDAKMCTGLSILEDKVKFCQKIKEEH